jgi:hypothetical protein
VRTRFALFQLPRRACLGAGYVRPILIQMGFALKKRDARYVPGQAGISRSRHMLAGNNRAPKL